LLIVAASILAACATNPATGRRQLMLVSEGQEIAMGQQADPEIVAQFGLVPDSGLQQYVREIGARLAGLSERPDLPWTFRVLDDPVVNAFALPGGFNYVTRGILGYFNSEAELAGVMGHELGHVTARHSASQMTKQTLAGVGLVTGMILVPDLQDYAGVASAGLQLMFLRFSRDDEREADDLGLRYMYRAGYDPREMPNVFAMLDRVSRAAGAGRVPGWLSTHPDPEDRQGRMREKIAALPTQDFSAMAVKRNEYLRQIDGMVYGENPREGYMRGENFLHPDLEFQITFPPGWRTLNQKQALLAQPPDKDALFQLTFAQASSPRAGAQEFLTQEGVSGGPVQSGDINGNDAASAGFRVQTEQGVLEGLVVFVSFQGNIYRLMGYAPRDRWARYQQPIRSTMGSFDRLTDREALNVQPMRLDVVAASRRMTLAQFVAEVPTSVTVETMALLNQMEPTTQLSRGQLVKRVAAASVRRRPIGLTASRAGRRV
jgi:predicted Zn-dependent protease